MERELKAKHLLKTKVFRQASMRDPMDVPERTRRAHACLTDGANAGIAEMAALAQAKLAFVQRALELCQQYEVRAVASIVPKDAPRPTSDYLRKDYSYLFERFYYFLAKQPAHCVGLVVFDELERSQSHLLIDQMERYFVETRTGQTRAARIVPEPFFVHSHLTTGVQLADLVAYTISWGLREGPMRAPARAELKPYADVVSSLRHDHREGTNVMWGFNLISDLRPRVERPATTAVARAFFKAWSRPSRG